MEQFVKMLHDRLETKKELQLQLYVIMQNAINEMHNNGIIASLIDKPLVKMNRRRAFLQNYLVRNNASLSVKGK